MMLKQLKPSIPQQSGLAARECDSRANRGKARRAWLWQMILLFLVTNSPLPLTLAQAQAPNIKLNGPLVSGGNVEEFQISPDNTHVVYKADQDTDGLFELYSVPLAGGTPVKLNGPLAGGREGVLDFKLSSDSSRVVYTAYKDRPFYDLFSVPLRGGTPTRLTPLTHGPPNIFLISPDSSRVVYTSIQSGSRFGEVFSVPLAGGAPIKLSNTPPITPPFSIHLRLYQISPDSSRVIYSNPLFQNLNGDLFSVPLTGGTPTMLNQNNFVNWVQHASISPDSSRVIYYDFFRDHLFSVPLTGGSPVQLDTPPGFPGTPFGVFDFFKISLDSSRVVYSTVTSPQFNFDLFSVPLTGGTSTRLNITLAGGIGVTNYGISPDSSRVVYSADQDSPFLWGLYSVPLAGGIPTKLNSSGTDTTAFGLGFDVSPDSSRVIYSSDPLTTPFELFSVPLTGGASTKLNRPVADSAIGVVNALISPNSSRVVYVADQDMNFVFELFSVPPTGGAPRKLNGPLVSGGTVAPSSCRCVPLKISPDSSRVVYNADQDTDEVFELYTQTTAQVIQNLIDDVGALVVRGALNGEQGNGLTAKLEAAIASLGRGQTTAACNQLQAFINQVNAFINNRTLTPQQAQQLIGVATNIKREIGCSPTMAGGGGRGW